MNIHDRINWRVWLGLGLTFFWLGLAILYISAQLGWVNLVSLPANQLGAFLDGAFAPLAFLWLVIGYFLQKLELEQTTIALQEQAIEIRRAAEQAAFQSEKMAASEVHARQRVFLELAEHVRRQLGNIAGMLFISSQGASGSGLVSNEEEREMFALMSQDSQLFSRRLLEVHRAQRDDQAKYGMFYGTDIRARHSNRFIEGYERLIERAVSMDTDSMISEAVGTSAHGLLYKYMKAHQDKAPPELLQTESDRQ